MIIDCVTRLPKKYKMNQLCLRFRLRGRVKWHNFSINEPIEIKQTLNVKGFFSNTIAKTTYETIKEIGMHNA